MKFSKRLTFLILVVLSVVVTYYLESKKSEVTPETRAQVEAALAQDPTSVASNASASYGWAACTGAGNIDASNDFTATITGGTGSSAKCSIDSGTCALE